MQSTKANHVTISGVPYRDDCTVAVAFTLLAAAGHLGGLLAYSFGVQVADDASQRRAFGEN